MLEMILDFGGIIATVFVLIAIFSISGVKKAVKNLYIEDDTTSIGEDNGKASKINDILDTLQRVGECNGYYDKNLMGEMIEQYNALFLLVRDERVLQIYSLIIDSYENNGTFNLSLYNKLLELFRKELGLPKINVKKQKSYLSFSHKLKNATKTKKQKKEAKEVVDSIKVESIIEENEDATKTSNIVKKEVIDSIKVEKGLKGTNSKLKKVRSGAMPKKRIKKD